ncbi:MAG TPA: ABC transporter ATP-binding protein, partial [Dongiaceae bacterium]|nr:ABC transporter ATP-binding protein [Dongiaceae bacterium]
FLHPTEGRVLIKGKDCTLMAPAQRPTATVFQDYALFPHMSVGSNVAFGLRMQGVPKAERLATAREMLRIVGLDQAFDKRPHQLSGGQRQRVALARALVVQPAVLLLDEPLGALDLKLRRQMQDELKAIQKRVGTAFVHVTHDQEEAMALADHIVVMNLGRIEDEGPPERVYARPATRFAATFMGESTIVPGRVGADGRVVTALGAFPAQGLTPGSAVHIAIRPEHVQVGPAIAAIVKDVVYQGSFKRVTATLANAPDVHLLARLPAGTPVQEGAGISLSFDPAEVIVLRD